MENRKEGKMKCEWKEKIKKRKGKENEEGREEERLEEKKEGLTCVRPYQFVWRERFFFLWKTYKLCRQGRSRGRFLQQKVR